MTFAERWHRALYGSVPIQCGAPQLHQYLRGLPDNDQVYSDIQLHLPVLQWFAGKCDHVTEFGVRRVKSTLALLAGARKKVVSYDIQRTKEVDEVLALELPVPWEFHERSSVDPALVIEPTGMLFIDTVHTGEQVGRELRQHWGSVCSGGYVALHDTETFWGHHGFGQAIVDFLSSAPGLRWETAYRTDINNGLWVIQKW